MNREKMLEDALTLVLDDWANANLVGEDARARAEMALDAPRSASKLEERAKETSVLMGFDAMRICMNMDPTHFQHGDVIQWMNNLRRDTNTNDWQKVPTAWARRK